MIEQLLKKHTVTTIEEFSQKPGAIIFTEFNCRQFSSITKSYQFNSAQSVEEYLSDIKEDGRFVQKRLKYLTNAVNNAKHLHSLNDAAQCFGYTNQRGFLSTLANKFAIKNEDELKSTFLPISNQTDMIHNNLENQSRTSTTSLLNTIFPRTISAIEQPSISNLLKEASNNNQVSSTVSE